MFIRELAKQTGVTTKTIRFYESIGLLPRPRRAANNYRQYSAEAVERLQFIASARGLGFGLDDIAEFLQARDAGRLPCRRVIDSMETRIADLDQRIADLLTLRATLKHISRVGKSLPPEKNCDADCLCNPLTLEYGIPLQESANVRTKLPGQRSR